MSLRQTLIVILLILSAPPAWAGFIELGASANYKFSSFDENNTAQTISYTGSIAYYFWEQCALEVSYTSGYSKQVSQASINDDKYVIEDNFDMGSLDLVLSLAGKEAALQPYIKLGGGYMVKERFIKVNNGPKLSASEVEGLVPSAGIGIKFALTNTFSIKVGVDAWSSPLDNNDKRAIDYSGRAGVSWMF